jgi:predicted O-methyltransferase YrrM
MKKATSPIVWPVFIFLIMVIFPLNFTLAQHSTVNLELDKKVEAFLKSNKNRWHDLNVPDSDGKLLYDIIIRNGYTSGLEIGTSTGHSAIWIAWAFSKTNGKLITIEINERRYKEAIANFEAAGLSEYIDARLGNAHDLVRKLQGPFDFVFSDADKDWYTNYFIDVAPKLKAGGCFAAHNVRPAGAGGISGTKAYLAHVMGLDNFTTTVNNTGGGLAISIKNN